jgi:NitT/TauT family transport system substrate-binding protein
MKRTIRLAALILLFAAPIMPAHAAPDAIVLTIPAELVSLLPLYVAEDTQLWEKAGLDVKIVTIPSVGGMNAVIAGSADFSFSTGAAITRAAAHGQKLVAIVELADESGQIIVLRKDLAEAAHFDPAAPLAVRAQVLKGRTMAIGGVASSADAFLKVVAHEAGLDSGAIVTTPMSSSEQMAAFARQSLDGFVSGAPYAQQAVHDGTGVVIADGSGPVIPALSPSAAGLLVTRPGYCGDHRSICERMGHSMVEAVDFIYAQPQQALALLKKHFPAIDESVLGASYDAVKKMTPHPPLTTAQGLANSELINVRAGFLPPDQRLKSYDDLFTNEFAK